MSETDFTSKSMTLFPDDHKYLTFLKKVFRHELRKNGFRRMSLPVVEQAVEVAGEQTISDDAGNLRKNSHKSMIKTYISNNLEEEIQPIYYYYMSRFFEKIGDSVEEEYRIGGDILGEKDPILDAIIIYITYIVLNQVSLQDTFSIHINSLGLVKEQEKYKEELYSFFADKKHILSEQSQQLLETNPIKILQSTDEDDQILIQQAPKISKFWKKESKAHYASFVEYLDILGVPYTQQDDLVSTLGYETHSIWQFRCEQTQEVISTGMRYNALSTQLGNKKEIPAVGFHTNTQKIISMFKDRNIKIRNKDKIDLYFVQLGDEAKKVVLPLSLAARKAGINTVVSLGTPSMKEQMLKANRSDARFVVMVGVMEARNGIFQLRDQESGTQTEVKSEELLYIVIEQLGTDKLDFYSPIKDLIIG